MEKQYLIRREQKVRLRCLVIWIKKVILLWWSDLEVKIISSKNYIFFVDNDLTKHMDEICYIIIIKYHANVQMLLMGYYKRNYCSLSDQ